MLEKLSLSFHPASDHSSASSLTYFQCLIGAQAAMARVLLEKNTLKQLLMSYQASPENYFVQVGFNEELLDSSGLHQEEVYIYLTKEVEAHISNLLNDLTKLFHPFPCVLVMPGNSYCTPILSNSFDSITLDNGGMNYQILKLTNHLEEWTTSGQMGDMESTPEGEGGGRESGGGGAGGNKNTSLGKPPLGSGGNEGRAGEAPNDGASNDEPSDREAQLNIVERKGKTCTPEVTCNSDLALLSQHTVSSNSCGEGSTSDLDMVYQTFQVCAVVAIDVGHKFSWRSIPDAEMFILDSPT
jgi:hypothetical protein